MRKILSLIIFIAITLSITIANEPRNYPKTDNNVVEKQKHSVVEDIILPNRQNKIPRVVAKPQMKRSKIVFSDQLKSNSYQSPTAANLLSVSSVDDLVGVYICKGYSYFGGSVTGETSIRADETQENKFWISNLVPGGSNLEVYGTFDAENNTISIPQGQRIYSDGLDKASLSIFGSSDPVEGMFNATNGVITIISDLWGSEASDGWYELFEGAVTYTKSDMLPPESSYIQPQGGLFLGLIPETWDAYYSTALVNSAYSTWNWKNTSLEEGVSYSWSYTDSISGKNFTSGEDSLFMDVAESYYNMPVLTATNDEGLSGNYVLGIDYSNEGNESYAVAGGNASWLGFDVECDYGVANLDHGLTLLYASGNSYYFGTGVSEFADNNIESLMVFYDEPLSSLYFEGVNVYLFVLDAPDETEFTMNVVLAEKGEEDGEEISLKGDVVASATIKAKDAQAIMYNDEVVGYTLMFNEFENIDIDGFSTILEYIEMDKAFFLELTGFNVPGVELAVCTEELNPTDGESRSNFIMEGEDSSIYSWVGYRQTMYFNLDAAVYSYLSFEKNTIYDDGFGGSHEVAVSPYFDTLTVVTDSLPDWLSVEIIDEEYSDTKWGATAVLTYEPLDAETEPREFDLVFKTTAASRAMHIIQGGEEPSSSDLESLQSVYVVNNKNGYTISYPEEIKKMSLYTSSGEFIEHVSLPNSGRYELNNTNWSKGLYLAKFESVDGTKTLKLVK